MKLFKQISATLLAAAVGIACLSACTLFEKSEDPFEGALSDRSYATQDAAIVGFLEEEINGQATEAELVKYVKQADLTAEEIAALPLGDLSSDEITHAERGQVTYRTTMPGSEIAQTAAADDNVKTHGLYLLETGEEFRYFVPPTLRGEPITKSYFEDVFDLAKYENCTAERNTKVVITSVVDGVNQKVELTTTAILKVSNGVLEAITTYSNININGTMPDPIEMTYAMRQYIVETNGKFIQYIDGFDLEEDKIVEDGTIMEIPSDMLTFAGKTSVSSYIHSLYNLLDFSFFEKTADGFCISSAEKYLRACRESSYFDSIYGDDLDNDIFDTVFDDFLYECKVANGRIEQQTDRGKMKIDMSSSMDTAELTEGILEIENNLTFRDFGSTASITLPDRLKEYIAAQSSENS